MSSSININAAAKEFMHFLMTYTLAPDYLERRSQYRSEHLALAWQAQERGDLLLAGALAEPADRALLVFQGETSQAARDFAAIDPYVKHGLVTSWTVQPWNTVVGDMATNPIRG